MKLKARFDGVNYSLSQPTLEQVCSPHLLDLRLRSYEQCADRNGQVYLSLVKAHTGKHESDLLSKGKSLQVHPFDE